MTVNILKYLWHTDIIAASLAVMGLLLVYHQQEAASVCSKYTYIGLVTVENYQTIYCIRSYRLTYINTYICILTYTYTYVHMQIHIIHT